MASQQFCLRWNNYQNNLLDVFSNLLSSEHFCDVTLACDGKLLKAHKMVLSACSTFFQEIFLNNPCKHPVVFIKDVKYSELHSIVEFMYRGEVNISQDQLSSLLKTAEALQVKGLAEVGSCEQSNESSQDESHKMSMSSIINNDDDNRSNVEKPKNSSRRSYPPSPKRLKTQRTETQSQEIIQQRIQTFHQSPAPSSQAQTDINDIVPPQEIELEDDVKPILIKNSPKSYTIDESNSNDLDMYSSYAEQPFEEPDGEPYGNVELTQIANNIDLDQNQSSSSSILPAAGNSTVSRKKSKHKRKSNTSKNKNTKTEIDLALRRAKNAIKQRRWRAMLKLNEDKYNEMKAKERIRKQRARLRDKASEKDRFSPEIFKIIEEYRKQTIRAASEKRCSSSSKGETSNI